VVEDEFIIAQSIENSLKMMGYTVIGVVSSGKKAIEKTEAKKPDLILMDIKLHGDMDGIEAAYQIQSRFNIPVIYLTACSDEYLKARAEKTNPAGYIIKPFKNQTLKSAIEMGLCRYGGKQWD
jgi:CheY-like chemotaxis protein